MIGLRFGNSGGPGRFGALDGNVAVGFCRGHFRIALDAGDVRATHVGDVLVLVAHFFECEAHDLEPHLVHVARVGGAHAVRDHLRLFHDLLDGELADDPTQMAFHHEPNQALALFRPLGQELLRRGADGHRIGLHLDLGNGLHRDGHALLRVEALLRSHVKRHQLERQLLACLNHGENDRAATLHDACATHAVNNERLVRAYLAIHPRYCSHDQDHRQNGKSGDDWNQWKPEHIDLPFPALRRLFRSFASPKPVSLAPHARRALSVLQLVNSSQRLT